MQVWVLAIENEDGDMPARGVYDSEQAALAVLPEGVTWTPAEREDLFEGEILGPSGPWGVSLERFNVNGAPKL